MVFGATSAPFIRDLLLGESHSATAAVSVLNLDIEPTVQTPKRSANTSLHHDWVRSLEDLLSAHNPLVPGKHQREQRAFAHDVCGPCQAPNLFAPWHADVQEVSPTKFPGRKPILVQALKKHHQEQSTLHRDFSFGVFVSLAW